MALRASVIVLPTIEGQVVWRRYHRNRGHRQHEVSQPWGSSGKTEKQGSQRKGCPADQPDLETVIVYSQHEQGRARGG